MKRPIILAVVAMMSLAASAETALWLRDAKISPDGSKIAFTYKGDIYTVPVAGGKAIRLTTQPSYETQPVWSPDGSKIAFASDRNGGFDVFIMPASGGSATRLTTNSVNELPESFTADGKKILFSANIQDAAKSALFPKGSMTELYEVAATGGRTHRVAGIPTHRIDFMPDGKSYLFYDCKGVEDEWRKHHTSSVTRDIWLYDAKTSTYKNLTDRAGEDRDPVIAPDGKTVYMLSEPKGGTLNVYSFAIDNPKQLTKVTDFKTHPVRFLSIADNGTLAFSYDGELYTLTSGQKPHKLTVDIVRDDYNPLVTRNVRATGSAVPSPDGKQIAFIDRGTLFVTATDYPSTKQVTAEPRGVDDPTWAADGRSIVYTSDRDGHWNLYKATIARADDPNFSNATVIDEKELFPTSDGVERTGAQFSPDGKQLAFIKDRDKLMVMNVATGKVRQLTDGRYVSDRGGTFGYAWSPDGKWIAMEIDDRKHSPYCDIAVVNVESGEVTNLTNSGYFDTNPRWAFDGAAILFDTDRYGMRAHASWGSQRDAMLIFLNQDAYDRFRLSEEDYALLKDIEKAQQKKSAGKDAKTEDVDKNKAVEIELEGADHRLVRLTPNSSNLGSAVVTADGKSLYYMTAFEGRQDLWKIDLRKGGAKMVKKMNTYARLVPSADGKTIFIMGRNPQKMDPKSEKITPITASAVMTYNPAAERAYMYEQVITQEREKFYEPGMHGVDWPMLAAAYRKFLPHISNNYDFAELLSELLGELNVSHTGGRYYPAAAKEPTASLGLFFALERHGKGLLVEEILKEGPFDRATSDVRPGNIVEKIDGVEIGENTDWSELLNGKTRKKTLVAFYDPKTGNRWEEVVLPISRASENRLLYKRWVAARAADVDRMSNGRLGYVHIEGMNDDSFRAIYADILGKYNNREGIVIDTRFNGGGRLHEDIEVLFSGKKYFTQVVRGKEICDMPSRRWNKPSIMVQGEANYSNAHGTPWVYKHNGLGKLVGAPVPGTMTSVNWMTLQDPTLVYGIPVTGCRLADGTYLENTQLEPDILVLNAPESITRGEDQQLKAAVDELLREIDSKR